MLRNSLLCAAALLLLPACTYNVSGSAENRSVESAGLVASNRVDVPGDAEFAGMIVNAHGDVGRDLELAGASVRSDARVGGNLTAEGARVRFTGFVAGNAEFAAGTAYINARIAGDTEIAAGRVTLDGEVGGRLAMDAGRMELRGTVLGPVELRGHGRHEGRNGRIELAGHIAQGGLVCATEVEIRRTARIEGDLLVISNRDPGGEGYRFEPLSGRDCEHI
jgi:cytoskeletal protein CcmA (bactofilin family)